MEAWEAFRLLIDGGGGFSDRQSEEGDLRALKSVRLQPSIITRTRKFIFLQESSSLGHNMLAI